MQIGRKRPALTLPFSQNDDREIIFLTVCTKARKPILAAPEIHELLTLTWQNARAWIVGCYLLMPDHVHLFCTPGSSYSLESWVSYWKSVSARRWPDWRHQPVWQRCYWDTKIRQDDHYDEKWTYVGLNPVRAGLVKRPEDWPYKGHLNRLT